MTKRTYSQKIGRRVSRRRRRRSSRKLHKRRSRHHRGGGVGAAVDAIGAGASAIKEKATQGAGKAGELYDKGVTKMTESLEAIPGISGKLEPHELRKLVEIILGATLGGAVFGGLAPAALSGIIASRSREIAASLPEDSEDAIEMLLDIPDKALGGIMSHAPLTSKALGKTVGLAGAAGTYALGGDVLDSLAVGGVAGAGSQYLGKKYNYGKGEHGLVPSERRRRMRQMDQDAAYTSSEDEDDVDILGVNQFA